MAITHIGSTGQTVIDAGNTISAAVPSGLQAGDLILCVTSDRPATTTPIATSTIANFTRLTPKQRLNESYYAVHYKIATGGETTISASLTGNTYGSCVLTVSVFRGVDQRYPFNEMAHTGPRPNSNMLAMPAITPSKNECYMVAIITQGTASGGSPAVTWTGTSYTKLTEHAASNATLRHLTSIAGVAQQAAATIPTQTATSGATGSWAGSVLALRPAYETYVRDDGATSYWKLDETNKNGTTCVATIGTSLTYSNGILNIVGRVGQAAYFPTGEYHATANTNSSLETRYQTHTNISLECWAAFHATARIQGMINKRQGSNVDAHYTMFFYGGVNGTNTIVIDLGGTRFNTTYTPPTDQVFRHYCFTYTQATGAWRLYVNGVEVAMRDNIGTVTPVTNDAPFKIGYLNGVTNSGFAGGIDEVAVYMGIALTPSQVVDHYKAGIPKGVKVWNGSTYVERPYRVRNAAGGYVEAPVKIWNGTHWIDQ